MKRLATFEFEEVWEKERFYEFPGNLPSPKVISIEEHGGEVLAVYYQDVDLVHEISDAWYGSFEETLDALCDGLGLQRSEWKIFDPPIEVED